MAKVKKEKGKVRKILEGVFTGLFLVLIAFSCYMMISNTVKAKKSNNTNAPVSLGNSYFPVIVLSDSMEPLYSKESAIFIKKMDCEKIIENFNNGENVDLAFYNKSVEIKKSDEANQALANKSKYENTTGWLEYTMTHRLFYVDVHEDISYGNGRYNFYVEGINENSTNYSAGQYQVFTENELYGVVTGSSKFLGGCFTFIKKPIGLIILLLIPSLYMILSSIIDLIKAGDEEEQKVASESDDKGEDPLSGISEKNKKKLKEELLGQILGKDDEES